jgi:predicted 3-demethylubiquinone-9 3-methyltransferase (glyoxalase superfamily)/GNAT superfamily N-acetyltransferase
VPTTIEVRLLDAGDDDVLERVADGAFDNPVIAASAAEFLSDPRHHIAVAIDDGTVVGFVSAVHYVHPDKRPEMWINEVQVAPTHRRRGLAARMLELVIARGRELGCTEAWVLTEKDNAAARGLYASLGGEEDDGNGVMFTFRLPGTADADAGPNRPKVATCLWYDDAAEEAARFYVSLLPDSRITSVARREPDGPALVVEFTLAGAPYQALNGGPVYTHSEAASISVSTRDQEETDRLWEALTADGGCESRCGWLKDRFGVSWQIVPAPAMRLLGGPDRAAAERAWQAVLGMGKIDIAAVEAAHRGG